MLDIPKWLSEILPDIKCYSCKKLSMKQENIMAIGIRKSSKNSHKTVFFFDYLCDCGQSSITEFPDPMDVEDFVNMMVDEYIQGSVVKEKRKCSSKNCNKNPDRKVMKSKISQEEVEELKKLLNKCKDYPSLLLGIGVPIEDINSKRVKKCKK